MVVPKPPTLRVGVFLDQLYASTCFIQNVTSCWNPEQTQHWGRGIDIEIFEAIMRLLQWDYKYTIITNRTEMNYGNYINGSGTGLIGMMARNEIDCSALSIRVDEQRMQVVDFSFPVNYFQQVFVINQKMDKGSIRFVFNPFQPDVWLILAGLLLLATLVHWFSLSALKLHNQEATTKLIGFPNCLWEMIGVLLKQYYGHYWFASRIMLVTFWTFFCLVTTNWYQSTMNSMLAVPLPTKVPFKSIGELITIMAPGSWHLTYPINALPRCPPSQCGLLQEAVKRAPVRLTADVNADVLANKGVYFGSEDTKVAAYPVTYYNSGPFFAVIRDDTVDTQWIAYAFRKNFTRYLNHFNSRLIEILPGTNRIIARYKRAWAQFKEQPKATQVKLSLEHLSDCFVLVAGGLILALMVFGVEIFWQNSNSKMHLLRDWHSNYLRPVVLASPVSEENQEKEDERGYSSE